MRLVFNILITRTNNGIDTELLRTLGLFNVGGLGPSETMYSITNLVMLMATAQPSFLNFLLCIFLASIEAC
jgi:hypothetical protein